MPEDSCILVTGASGYIGSRFVKMHPGCRTVSLTNDDVNQVDFTDIKTVLHLAGIAHRMGKTNRNLYFEVNRDLTIRLAQRAKEAGVQHFVYLSSLKVFTPDLDGRISAETECLPVDAYGQSKLEAELALKSMQDENFRAAIIRPPLVFGPGAKGNLDKLMRLLKGKAPLPFANIGNARSMIYLDNLIDYVKLIIDHEHSGTYVPVDHPPVSTTRLVEILRDTINPHRRISTFPKPFLFLLSLMKPGVFHRLFGDLVVDTTGFDQPVGYQQSISVETGIKRMAEAFMARP